MIQIYTAGAADTRKKNEPPPPAGFGAVATQGGGVGEIFRICGQIAKGSTPNVKTTTQNLAHLVAFTRALQWARSNGRAHGRPICIRYNSEYAARIATGAWKAKKHKAFAEEARRAWAQLKRAKGGLVWMQHVWHEDQDYVVAAKACARGQERAKRILGDCQLTTLPRPCAGACRRPGRGVGGGQGVGAPTRPEGR